ncbi:MAG TPA: crosslink repair DNA glycosylase YcaQ family protein, partial [Fimbriimonas sp.]|nr:crosslink repair DNA glycosylase YcaQ family protein [Fimbriimonas sp.]
MSAPLKLSKADARRVLVRDQFEPCATAEEAFRKLRSIQFDPIAPVGCNHDLVLQARVPGYKIGDWEKLAYKDRFIYDGWDKQASLVPYEGWPVRRFFHALQRRNFDERVFSTQQDAVAAVLGEIRERGAMQPKDFEFQAHREEWKGTWYGPSVTKQVLRALWHTGEIMTTDRR